MTNNGAHARVNGLEMYYEIHGTGEPLVVLRGAYMTIELLGDLVPMLAKNRQVIGIEFQGHGHTADIDRPFSYEQFADDVAALLAHIEIDHADVYGYSPRRRRSSPARSAAPSPRPQARDRVRVVQQRGHVPRGSRWNREHLA
jgi:hypothetical protein